MDMLSEKKWSNEAVTRLFLAVLASYCFGIIMSSVVESMRWGQEMQRHFAEMVISGVSFHGLSFAWIYLFLLESDLSLKEAFGFCKSRLKAIRYALLAGTFILPVAWGLQIGCDYAIKALLNRKADPQFLVEELMKPDMPLKEQVFVGFLAIVMAPVVEEILFRGVLYPTCKRFMRPWIAVVVVSIGFGAFHMNWVSFLPLTLFGAILIWLYEKTGNLLASIIAHSLFNSVNFFFLVFNEPIIHWLNGE